MIYDLIVVGLGPAGLSAGIYGRRSNLSALVIGAQLGGTMNEAWKIENYPGFESISGTELAQRMKKQLEKLGGELIEYEVIKIKKSAKQFEISTKDGKKFETRTLILALGTRRRQLNVPGEEKLQGRGVSYCATCDSPFFKNKTAAVVGGGDSALKAALLIAQHAKKVYILVRGKEPTGEAMNIQTVSKNPKIEIIYNVSVAEIKGENKVEGVVLSNKKEMPLDGVFIEIGMIPASALISELKVALDERGFIKVDENQKTNVGLVYAAGDVTNAFGGFKQILTACAQGAVAATSAYKNLIQAAKKS